MNRLESIFECLPTRQWRDFAYFSANLQHILGRPFGRFHLMEFLRHKTYGLQQATLSLSNGLDNVTKNRDFKTLINGSPSLIVSFHYGSYRTLPLWILSERKSVCVLMSQDVIVQYSQYYKQLIIGMEDIDKRPGLLLLRAEDPSLFFKVRQIVNLGFHLFVYADGGKGCLEEPNESQLTDTMLLNASIKVRTGYLAFAHFLGLSVHLVLERSQDIRLSICKEAEIYCCHISHSGTDRKEFVKRCTREIYSRFGKIMEERPYLWEALLYFHRSSRPISNLSAWNSQDRIVPFQWKMNNYALDRKTYRVYSR